MRKKHAVCALLLAALAFLIRFGVRFLIDGTILYTNIIALYSHYIAGFCIFIASAWFLNRAPLKIVKYINDYSFEIYLYHYMFMRPPLSVMEATDNWYVNSILAVAVSFMTAWFMHGVGEKIRKRK